MPRNPACERCPLHEGAAIKCIWGNGPRTAEIMFIASNPGSVEDRVGLPLQGPAGKEFDRALIQAGLKRDQVYATNICKCISPNNREPTTAEAKACFSYLVEEIEAVHPKIIVALGGPAIKLLTGKQSIAKGRGSLLEPAPHLRLNGAKLIGTYHPAAYLHSHNQSQRQGLVEDLVLAAKLVQPRKRDDALPANVQTLLTPGYTTETLADALTALESATVVAVDCEWTYATDRRIAWPWTRGAELFSISLSGRVDDSIQSVGIAMPLSPSAHIVLADFLRGRKAVFHNAMADLIWLAPLKLPITLAGDTMLLAHLLNESAKLSLATLAQVWLGIEDWKGDLWRERPKSAEGWEGLLDYNTQDTYATILLAEKLTAEMKAMDPALGVPLERLYRNLCLPSVPMFVRMALRGMPLPEEKITQAIAEQTAKLDGLLEQFSTALDCRPDEALSIANSPMQIKRLLRESYRIDVDTSSAAIMEELAAEYPLCDLIQKIKHQQKLLGTYLKPWAELLSEQGDGRLHSIYSITRTVTGRTATEAEKGAGIQLVPREEWIRTLFEAPDGYILDSLDYSQLELRIAATVAGEDRLLGFIRDAVDPHRRMAATIANIPEEQVTKKQRQDAKPVSFGFLYGMGAEKFRVQTKKDYGIDYSPEAAETARRAFFTLYPGFQPWYQRCAQQFRKGYVQTLFGRVRRSLPDENKVANTLVQTPATELCMLALVHFDRWLQQHPELDSQLVGFVHDSGMLLRPDDERGEMAVAKLKEIMEHPPTHLLGVDDLGVPLDAEVKSGKHWA